MNSTKILIKLSGESFKVSSNGDTFSFISSLIAQLKTLSQTKKLGIILGGGNFFRGSIQGKQLGLPRRYAHQVGMLATLMNGTILQGLLEEAGVSTALFSAIACPSIAESLSQHAIDQALANGKCLIFAGGAGNPFFTADTAAVIRALQMGASEVWKGTKVDGIYQADPEKDPSARLLKKLSYDQLISDKLNIIDRTAATLAQEHQVRLRVFNVFKPEALLNAANDSTFGSTVE